MARPSRKALLLVALVMLAATMFGVAGAASKKESTKSKQDASSSAASALPGSAKGEGTLFGGGTNFKFKAKSTKGGGSASNRAKGKYSLSFSGHVKGKVRCLEAGKVDDTGGAAAFFSGKVKKTNISGFKGKSLAFEAFDSGQPNGAGDTLAFGAFDTPTCTTPTPGGDPISSGDIVVTANNPLA